MSTPRRTAHAEAVVQSTGQHVRVGVVYGRGFSPEDLATVAAVFGRLVRAGVTGLAPLDAAPLPLAVAKGAH